MRDEGAALCNVLNSVITELKNDNINVASSKIYGITKTNLPGATCILESVYPVFGTNPSVGNEACPFPDLTTGNSMESWGPASSIVSQRYNWKKGNVRVVIPISDEAACQGNPTDDLDIKTVDNLITIAKAQGVIVSPILGTLDSTTGTQADYNKVRDSMQKIADATKGTLTISKGLSTSTDQMRENLKALVRSACQTVTPPCSDNNKCTTNDRCEAGKCVGDAVLCPSNQKCDPADGICKFCFANSQCDDGDRCTDDSCDTSTGKCRFVGKSCRTGQKCDGRDGVCKECVATSDCDDSNRCTNDRCVDGRCKFDAISCPSGEKCDANDGKCKGCVSDGDCDDKNLCTINKCGANGKCTTSNVVCSDPLQKCDTADGKCKHCQADGDCDDKDLCTVDTCDSVSAKCLHTPKKCSSGNVCDTKDGDCKECLKTSDCSPIDKCNIATCSAAGKCVNSPRSCGKGQRCSLSTGACENTNRPPAPVCVTRQTAEDTPIVLPLNAVDPDGDSLSSIITRLPSRGKLYQFVPPQRNSNRDLTTCSTTEKLLDFNNFQVLNFIQGSNAPNWSVSDGGKTVQEVTNSPPTAFVFPQRLEGIYQIDGDWATPGVDDDAIGLIFGMDGLNDFFLMDWIREDQNGFSKGVMVKYFKTLPSSASEFNLPSSTTGQILYQNKTISRNPSSIYRVIVIVDTYTGGFWADIIDEKAGTSVSFSFNHILLHRAAGHFGPYTYSEPSAVFKNFGICTAPGVQITSTNFNVTDEGRRVVFVPPANGNGLFSALDWKATDGQLTSGICNQLVNVTAVNDRPVAISDTFTIPEGVSVTVQFTGSDVENSPLKYTVRSLPANGTLYQCAALGAGCTKGSAINSPNTVVQDAQGRAFYVPNNNAVGFPIEKIAFTANDGELDSIPAFVTINVKGLKGPEPTLGPQKTKEDTPLNIVLTSKAGDSGTVKYTLLQIPPAYSGTLQLGQIGGKLTNITQLPIDVPNGELVYTPAPDFNDDEAKRLGGGPFFVYRVYDDKKTSSGRKVDISVEPVNDVPVAIKPLPFNVKEGQGILIPVRGTDADKGDVLNVCLQAIDSLQGKIYQVSGSFPNYTKTSQQITPSSATNVPGGSCIQVTKTRSPNATDSTFGYFYYEPPAGKEGSPFEQFQFYVSDPQGAKSNIENVVINVIPSNDPPVANEPSPTVTDEDQPVIITLNGTDPDNKPDELTYFIDTPCQTGTLFQVTADNKQGAPIEPDSTTNIQVTNKDHKIIFVPRNNSFGDPYCSFGYYVKDPKGLTSPEKITPLTVRPKNDPPTAIPTTAQTKENTSVIMTLTGNDIDNFPNQLSAWITTQPSKGKLYQFVNGIKGAEITGASSASPKQASDPQGRVWFEPTPGEYGTQVQKGVPDYYTEYQFVIKDTTTFSKPAIATVGVDQIFVNGPEPTLQQVNTIEDKNKCFELTATPEGDRTNITYRLLAIPPTFTGTLHADLSSPAITGVDLNNGYIVKGNTLCFKPSPNFNDDIGKAQGSLAFLVYSADDGRKTSGGKRVPIFVAPVNDPPIVIQPRPFTGKAQTPIEIELLGKDVDLERLQMCINRMPAKGKVYEDEGLTREITSSGTSCTRIPNEKWTSGTVDTTVTLYYVATDPNADASPYDDFTFSAKDQEATSNIEDVRINISPNNRPPIAKDIGPQTTNEDQPKMITLEGTDLDNPSDPLNFEVTSPCKEGTLYQVQNGQKGALIAPDKTGRNPTVPVTDPQHRIWFEPLPNEFASPYCNFGFLVKETQAPGLSSPDRFVTVNVLPVNDPPIADPLTVQTQEDVPAQVKLSGSDIDNKPADLTCWIDTEPTKGKLFQYISGTTDNIGSEIIFAAPGSPVKLDDPLCRLVFVPDKGTYGTDDKNGVKGFYTTFNYTVKDLDDFSEPVAVPVGVTQLNFKPPTPTTPDQQTQEDTDLPITLAADPAGNPPRLPLTYKLTCLPPAHTGTLHLNDGSVGPALKLSDLPVTVSNGRVLFRPAEDYNDAEGERLGSKAYLCYVAEDPKKQSPPRKVNISVSAVNDPPVAIKPPDVATKPDIAVEVGQSGKDPEREILKVCIQNFPTKGGLYAHEGSEYGRILTPDGSGCVEVTKPKTHLNNSEETSTKLYYVPNADASGPDSFTFYVEDPVGQKSAPVTQDINIFTGGNVPPIAQNPGPQTTGEDDPITFTIGGIDPDKPSVKPDVYVSSPCENSTLYQVDSNGKQGAVIDASKGPVKLTNPDGKITYVPPADQNGSPLCDFGFYVQDPTGLKSNEETVPINVTPKNDPPTAIPTIIETLENKSAPVILNGTDIDSDDTKLVPFITRLPTNGSLTQADGTPITGASPQNPVQVTDPARKIIFVPTPGEHGIERKNGVTYFYTDFDFIVKDPEGASSNPATVPVGVEPAGAKPPQPNLDNITTPEDTNKTFTLTATDADTKPEDLVYQIADLPQKGTLYHIDPKLEKVVLSPGSGGSPTPVNITGGKLIFEPLPNEASEKFKNGSLKPYADFTYLVSDGRFTVPKKVDIFVTPVNDRPVGTTPSPQVFKEGDPVNKFNLTGTDVETPPEKLRYKITKLPEKGKLQNPDNTPIDKPGTIVTKLVDDKTFNESPFTPLVYVNDDPHANGVNYDDFEYVVIDEEGLESIPKTVSIDIDPVNDKPIARVYSEPKGKENETIIIWVGGIDPDIQTDGDNLTAFITGFPKNGKLYQITQDGKADKDREITKQNNKVIQNIQKPNYAGAFAYVPNRGVAALNLDDITFYVEDFFGAKSDPLTFNVDVKPKHSKPVATGTPSTVQVYDLPVIIPLGARGDDGAPLELQITEFPAQGKLTQFDDTPITKENPVVSDPAGRVKYAPANDTNGPVDFAYKAVDKDSGLSSGDAEVRINVNSAGGSTPRIEFSDPEWTISGEGDFEKRRATFKVTATDESGDATRLIITKLPDPKSGTLSFDGKSITTGDIDPACDCVIIAPKSADVAKDGSASVSTWELGYDASSNNASDSVSFTVVDRQLVSPNDLAAFQTVNVPLNATAAKAAEDGEDGNDGGDGGDGFPIWAIFLIIIILIACFVCIIVIVVAFVLLRRRRRRGGYRRRRGGKKGGDQQYENLGHYQPPDL